MWKYVYCKESLPHWDITPGKMYVVVGEYKKFYTVSSNDSGNTVSYRKD